MTDTVLNFILAQLSLNSVIYRPIVSENRFGYDHPGGYDREMGGRPGYADDRPHGRFRSGGYPGGPSGNYLVLRSSKFRDITLLFGCLVKLWNFTYRCFF